MRAHLQIILSPLLVRGMVCVCVYECVYVEDECLCLCVHVHVYEYVYVYMSMKGGGGGASVVNSRDGMHVFGKYIVCWVHRGHVEANL